MSLTQDTFNKALQFTFKAEGGVSTNPHDLGNRGGNVTNMGVTQPVYNEYRSLKKLPHQSTTKLTKAEAIDLYHLLFWERAGCNLLPPKLAIAVFDTSVLFGVGDAVKFLQKALGADADGLIGSKTKAAIAARFKEDVYLSSFYVSLRRAQHRVNAKRGNQNTFLQGWLNRTDALATYLKTLS